MKEKYLLKTKRKKYNEELGIWELYVSKKEMENYTGGKPLYGYASKEYIIVRDDLPKHRKNFVRQHELEHVKRYKRGKSQPTWLREEALVSIKAFPKQPMGGIFTVLKSITSPKRFKFYWKTYKEQNKYFGR